MLVQKGRKGIEAGRQEPGQSFIDVSVLFGIFDGMNGRSVIGTLYMWEIKNREQGEVGERSSIEPQRVTISLSGKRLRNPRRKKNTGLVSEKVGPM